MNKNQLRETLRKHIHDAPYLDAGVERIVDQVVNPKVYSVFMSQIEDVVYKFLGIERPKVKEKNGACGLKDLLPKDLDPVSPESDKNSLKDVSLESIDASDMNDIEGKQFDKSGEQKLQDEEIFRDKKNKTSPENGHISSEEKILDEAYKTLNKTGSNLNLNTSGKSDDKMEDEDEEVSPTFEPIDIMNLNESNISNDSHLSGISELTSHRSRSPDFSNELSRDNFDCSNQDSQLSKVSSDSRLSIVTDFGSSNHGLTPVHDTLKDDVTKDKYEVKNSKDNFKAIREFDSSKKIVKSNFDFTKNKDTQDYKDSKDFKSTKSISSKENSRDATDSGMKDKYDKSSKEKNKDNESKSKNTKEKISSKDAKYYKDRSNERKKSRSHSSEKYDKHSKSKSKDKIDQVKENSDKAKDISETLKDSANKLKDDKLKETDKKDKDNINKEAKDLKDIYKEKIRELREKKELTEKEKLNKDKDVKLSKETKDKKDSLKDKKSNRKEHRSSSSSSSSKNIPVNYHENRNSKISEKIADGKDKRSDSKDKAKRDEKRLSKDNKGKSHYSSKTDLLDKSDSKKVSKNEKEDKSGKVDVKKDSKASSERTTNDKKDAKSYLQHSKSSDRNEKSDSKRDSKNDSPSKDKKRREDKKSKTKDDHSSLRKSSNDRRSTDRDGSNGSNSKTSPSNNTNSNMTNNKSGTSSLTKENNHVSNSGSETSDSIEETQMSDSLQQPNCKLSHKISLTNDNNLKLEFDNTDETYDKHEEEADSRDTNLPLKKRLLSKRIVIKEDEAISDDVKIRKPKFAKNIHEAKRLMKIRKLMEKEKLKEDKKEEKKITYETEQTSQSSTIKDVNNLEDMPDDERVQIIEIPDEEYEEPYPEKHETNLTLDERSIIMLGTESCTNDFLNRQSKSTLSNMELCIKQSLSEIVSNVPLEETTQNSKTDEKIMQLDYSHVEDTEASKEGHNVAKDTNNKTSNIDAEECSSQIEKTHILQEQKELIVSVKSESVDNNENKSTEQSMEEVRDYNETEAQIDNQTEMGNNIEEREADEKQIETCVSPKIDTIHTDLHSDCLETRSSSSVISDDNGEDCHYFKTDNKRSERFSSFLESLELLENSSLEDIIESLGGKVVLSVPKSMAAPPLPKLRKRSSSPLSDILVNNSDNNNEDHKRTLSLNEDTVHNVKKRRFNKKPRFSNLCNPQGVSNGENFVMPLSPDSDVSATSEKTSSNVIKEEKRYVLYVLEIFI